MDGKIQRETSVFLKGATMIKTPQGKIDIVIDTDTYNEVDDQFAIAYALASPELNIQALIAAPFLNAKASSAKDGMEKSKAELLKVLTLAQREELKDIVYEGCGNFLPDEKTPVQAEGVQKMIHLANAHTKENPLYIVGLAVATDIASALLCEPSIKDKIVVVWLGGHSREYEDTREFNMRQDIAAARILFQTDIPFVQIPCRGVASQFLTTRPEMDRWLYGKNELATYLVENADKEANTYAKGKPWSRVIWDVTAISWLLNHEEVFLKEKEVLRNLPEYDGTYSYPDTNIRMNYVYYVNRDALFEDLFKKLGY